MADETFLIELGGRRWELRRLPFGVLRKVQPALLRQAREITNGDAASAVYRLNEAALAKQAEAVALALRTVDPEMTSAVLDGMHFTPADLAIAVLQVLRACGISTQGAAGDRWRLPGG